MGKRSRGSRRQTQEARERADIASSVAAAAGGPPCEAIAAPPPLSPKRSVPGIKPTLHQVMNAIESLYKDQLKPFGRILRKRIAEQISGIPIEDLYGGCQGSVEQLPDIDVGHLQGICEESPNLHIQAEEGGDWSAVLVNRAAAGMEFVDIYCPDDPYPMRLWEATQAYFGSLTDERDMSLPGGRYACAQALVCRRLQFLSGYTVGQVCHIVQLAISKHKILGYSSGAVVPYLHSQSMRKERCAAQQMPCSSSSSSSPSKRVEAAQTLPLASWEVARRHLAEILEPEIPGGPALVPLSNVKRLFRSRYRVELSETMLGHSKLSDLLQDARFSDICSVQLQRHGYIVVRAEPMETRGQVTDEASEQPSVRATSPIPAAASAAAATAAATSADTEQPSDMRQRRGEILAASSDIEHERDPFHLQSSDHSPSVATPSSPRTVAPSEPVAPPRRRWNAGRRDLLAVEPLTFLEDDLTPASTPQPSPGAPSSATVRRWSGEPRRLDFPDDDVGGDGRARPTGTSGPMTPEAGGPLAAVGSPLPSRTPTPGSQHGSVFTGWLGEPRRLMCADNTEDLEAVPLTQPVQPQPQYPRTPPPATTSDVVGEGRQWPWTDPFDDSIVYNTFIHAKSPPPTPVVAARRRSQSVPKDCGSSQHWQHHEPSNPSPSMTRGGHSERIEDPAAAAAAAVHAAGPAASQTSVELGTVITLDGEMLPKETHEEQLPTGLVDSSEPSVTSQAQQPPTDEAHGVFRFCLDEPLRLEDASVAVGGPCSFEGLQEATRRSATLRWLVLSPFVLPKGSFVRMVVENALARPRASYTLSPQPQETWKQRRCQSMPPDLGGVTGASEGRALSRTLSVLPRLLRGIESECGFSATVGAATASVSSGALPSVPKSTTPLGGAQRVLRLADHL